MESGGRETNKISGTGIIIYSFAILFLIFFFLQWTLSELLFLALVVLFLIGGFQLLLKYLQDLVKSDPNWHLIEGLKTLDERSNM
jgi:Flp pilus assembly protein TadB